MPGPRKSIEKPLYKKGKKLRKKRVMPLELPTEDVDGDIVVSALRAIKPLRSLAKTTKKSKGENPYRDEWRHKQFEGVGKPLDKLQEEKSLLLESLAEKTTKKPEEKNAYRDERKDKQFEGVGKPLDQLQEEKSLLLESLAEDEKDGDIAVAACSDVKPLPKTTKTRKEKNPYRDEREDKQFHGVGQRLGEEFQAKSSEIQVVIKKLPASFTRQDIEDELLSLGYPVLRVFQMRTGAERKRIPKFLVHLERMPNSSKDIYMLKNLFHRRIAVEKYEKPQPIPQCKRCQSFFHDSKSCCLPPRCLKCSGEHFTADCTKPRNTPATCAHCGGPHPANYLGCRKFPKELQRLAESMRGSKKDASEALPKRQARRPKQARQAIEPSARLPQLESHMASIAISHK